MKKLLFFLLFISKQVFAGEISDGLCRSLHHTWIFTVMVEAKCNIKHNFDNKLRDFLMADCGHFMDNPTNIGKIIKETTEDVNAYISTHGEKKFCETFAKGYNT